MSLLTMKLMEVDAHGKIHVGDPIDCNYIIGGLSLDMTLGNESFEQAGDIAVQHRELFPGVGIWWLGAFYNDIMIDCFRVERNYDEMDLKKSCRYKSRLKSIQRIFYDDLDSTILAFENIDTDSWNYNLSNGAANLTIAEIMVRDGSGNYIIENDRAGFSLRDLTESLHGSHSDKNYMVDIVTSCGYKISDGISGLPIIYRGTSVDHEDLEGAVDLTFTNYDVTWLDVFKLSIFGFDAFVRVTPKIKTVGADDYLAIDVDVIPKCKIVAVDLTTPKWLTRNKLTSKYYMDGIHLSSSVNNSSGNPSFDYTQGTTEGRGIKVLEKSVDIADPEAWIPIASESLYWSTGYPDGLNWDINIGLINNFYFTSGHVAPYYAEFLDAEKSHGISGRIRYEGQRVGDHIYADEDKMQIYRLQIQRDKSGGAVADIEGILISET